MSSNRPRIAVDAMGGDFGPSVVVPGAVEAARRQPLELIFVGDAAKIDAELSKLDVSGLVVEVVHASQVAEMHEKPSDILRRKKDSSIHVACRLVKEGRADGVVSAGHTGATLACSMFILGRIKGVERPCLAGMLPTEKRPMLLTDVGANVDARAEQLFQFGIMAESLARTVLGYERPSVGLLSIGEEEGKGNSQVKEAFEMFRDSSVNFVGNVEGREIFTGKTDIVVCDGFVGNVALKLSEGLASSFGRILKRMLSGDWLSMLGALLARGAFRRFRQLSDYAEYGGAPILGLNGVVIVCHGASNSKAIRSAVDMAGTFIAKDCSGHLTRALTVNMDLTKFSRTKALAAKPAPPPDAPPEPRQNIG